MPDPTKYKDREDFVADCMAERKSKYPEETRQDRIRLCNAVWEFRETDGFFALKAPGFAPDANS